MTDSPTPEPSQPDASNPQVATVYDYENGYEFFWVMSFVFALWCGVMFHKHRWFEFAGISTRGKVGMLVFSFLCPTVLEIVIYIAQPHIFDGP